MSVDHVDPATGLVIPNELIEALQRVPWRHRRLDRGHATFIAECLVRASATATSPTRDVLVDCVHDLSYRGDQLSESHARRLVDAAAPLL